MSTGSMRRRRQMLVVDGASLKEEGHDRDSFVAGRRLARPPRAASRVTFRRDTLGDFAPGVPRGGCRAARSASPPSRSTGGAVRASTRSTSRSQQRPHGRHEHAVVPGGSVDACCQTRSRPRCRSPRRRRRAPRERRNTAASHSAAACRWPAPGDARHGRPGTISVRASPGRPAPHHSAVSPDRGWQRVAVAAVAPRRCACGRGW